MKAWIPTVSKGMLILGGLLMLAGMAWNIGLRRMSSPPPTITDAGAVVLAVTAPLQPTSSPLVSTPTATVTCTAASRPLVQVPGPTPVHLPLEQDVAPTPTSEPTSPPSVPDEPARMPTPAPTKRPIQKPPTRIVAAAIDLDAPVVPMSWHLVDYDGTMVSEWAVPDRGAGWHVNSGLPGQGENIVISGHHNIEGKVFRYVVNLNPGDEIELYVGNTAYIYVVTEKYILKEAGMPLEIRRKNAQWIMPTGDERLTLGTCSPYEWPGNSHRVIVVAKPRPELTPDTARQPVSH
jgi:LPXTG-site transpeptidase (sortase) family protein